MIARIALCAGLLLTGPAAVAVTGPVTTVEPAVPADSFPGYHLRARPLHGLPSPLAALILGGADGGEILISALAVPVGPAPATEMAAGDGDGRAALRRVALLLEVEGSSLLGPPGEVPPERMDLQIFVYALGAEGAIRAFRGQTVPIETQDVGEAVAGGGLKLLAHVDMPPDTYQLRILVHDPARKRFGLRVLAFEVPGSATRAPVLSFPLSAEPPGPWLLVAEPSRAGTEPVDVSELLKEADLPLPSALPVLTGETAPLDVLLTVSPAATLAAQGARFGPETIRARFRSIDEEGGVTEVPVAVREVAPTRFDGTRRVGLELPLDRVEPGSYFLSLESRIGPTVVTSPELGVIVLDRRSDPPLLWTDVQRMVRGEPPRAELGLSGPRGRRRDRDRVLIEATSSAYRTVLLRLAGGDLEGAVDDLLRIEDEAIQASDGRFPLLHRAEIEVVEALGSEDPTALVPVARLHQRAYLESRERRRYALAAYSRTMAVVTAERVAAAGGQAAPGIAASFLGAVGDELQQVQAHRSAEAVLKKALDIEPDNPFALLQLALIHERFGEYAEAADLLERLVATDPKAPEARLRLGINRMRTGRKELGAVVLRRLVREENPDWVLAVAYQTLAAERLRNDDPGRAVEWLREGLSRLPGQQRLTLQLAYALERAGRRVESHRIVAALPVPAESPPSPRHLYGLWPSAGRQETEETLARETMLRLGALGRALSRFASGGAEEVRR